MTEPGAALREASTRRRMIDALDAKESGEFSAISDGEIDRFLDSLPRTDGNGGEA